MDARMKAILILRRSASLGESQVEEREGGTRARDREARG